MTNSTSILVITPDVIGERMAGPAIRAWEIARTLSNVGTVRLVSTVGATITYPDFDVIHAQKDSLRPHAAWADIIIVQGHILRSHPWLKSCEAIIVADIYDPLHLEQLEQGKDFPKADRYAIALDSIEVMNDQMERADFMLCASEKQRDFWLGQLAGLARINPATYDQDPSLRSLLAVAPFGIQEAPPEQTSHGIRGVVDGIGFDDKVILWGGGIYNWFDPITLIEAIGHISGTHSDVRLFFLGVKHPNPDVPQMEMERRARELSDRLGLTNRFVFFNETWVPYNARANFLLDADVGVSTHLDHVETAYSFRTRILDYLWASLPIIATSGDTFAPIIEENELGITVPAQDVDALVQAIETLLFDDDRRAQTSARVRDHAVRLTWPLMLRPLIEFCEHPVRAADREYGVISQRNQIVADLNKRIAGMESSSSWQVTAPLRRLGSVLGALRHRVLK
ncbi:glycosyltransferase [Cryobacterium glaciale]|uniref:Glycosyltransferase n=1 Tax=Cryobacterium glaciale TaxID=1259145 RepID=A0A4R8V026_9MICO|nr:glycosyltransferase [Cryobacterium glaciale]TFB74346.1 glycosyltransferase [Cryobacterium glaciale]